MTLRGMAGRIAERSGDLAADLDRQSGIGGGKGIVARDAEIARRIARAHAVVVERGRAQVVQLHAVRERRGSIQHVQGPR